MEKKDLLKKQELAEELGMKFDEASELFSEETLETMRMMNVVGGNDASTNSKNCNCSPKQCNCIAGEGNDNSYDPSVKNCNCNPKACSCRPASTPEPSGTLEPSIGGTDFPNSSTF